MSDWREKDLNHVWHPFTQMQDFSMAEDLVIERGDGCWVRDDRGRWYFDGTASLWVNVHGHRDPALDTAVSAQLHRIAHHTLLGVSNPPAAELAERLIRVAPDGLNRVFYSDNGSTAVEVALKMVFQAWRQRGATGEQRTRFVALREGYHGDTIGSVSVGGMDLFHGIFHPLLFPTEFISSPNCYRCPAGRSRGDCAFECTKELETLLEKQGDRIAGMVVEPLVQGAGGQVTYPPEVLRRYREITRRRGLPLIVDEVATGFGRTGRMFACEHAGVEPDILCLAKGLTGGYLPVAATLACDEIYDAFLGEYGEFKTFFHGHTYTGNPLGCAVALASLNRLQEQDLPAQVADRSQLFKQALVDHLRDHPHVGDIRLVGLMGGVELVRDRAAKERFPVEARTAHRVLLKARECGLLMRPLGDVMVLMPPLAATDAELEFMAAGVAWAVGEILGPPAHGRPVPPVRSRRGSLAALTVEPVIPTAGGRSVLVTGTDTGVGKTVVAAALGLALREAGVKTICHKPVESGADGAERGPDQVMFESLGLADASLDRIALSAPVSPHRAAEQEGVSLDLDRILKGVIEYKDADLLFVEGAGGPLVPLIGDRTFLDLALEAEMSVLLVAPNRLGCLNHVFSQVLLLRMAGLSLSGVILNDGCAGAADDVSRSTNAEDLERYLGRRFLGRFPAVSGLDADTLSAAARKLASKIQQLPD